MHADFLSRLYHLDLYEVMEGKSSPVDPLDESNWVNLAYDAFHNLGEDMDSELADSFDSFSQLANHHP